MQKDHASRSTSTFYQLHDLCEVWLSPRRWHLGNAFERVESESTNELQRIFDLVKFAESQGLVTTLGVFTHDVDNECRFVQTFGQQKPVGAPHLELVSAINESEKPIGLFGQA